MFTAAQLANATSPDTALLIEDYPYGFRLRCQMRVWVQYQKGKGFRYWTQTSNPKRPGTWNNPKASTYARVCMAIHQDENGHLSPRSLTEYDGLKEYGEFNEANHENLSDDARASLRYFWDVKGAFEDKRAELNVGNYFDATPEQKAAMMKAAAMATAAHVKAGTAY